jgi:DNA-binding GntR family transcriptional regulator
MASAAQGDDRAAARRGLRDQVYDQVLDLILGGTLRSGERLGIDDLAGRLQVSPTPVREALAHLERTGLVTRTGFKGYRVAEPLTPEQVSELLDVRELLEVQAARWFARGLPTDLTELRAAHRRHIAAAAEVSERIQRHTADMRVFRAYFDADAAFHAVIHQGTGNRYLQQVVDDLGGHLHRMRETILHHNYDMSQAVAEHAAILSAAESGDPEAVVEAMQRHMSGIRRRSAVEE